MASATYTARCKILLESRYPLTVSTAEGVVTAGDGSEMTVFAATSSWPILPHVALANLTSRDASGAINLRPEPGLTLDENAVANFVKTFGFLHHHENTWSEPMSEFAGVQQKLRQAWMPLTIGGNPLNAESMSFEGFEMYVGDKGRLALVTSDLERYIEFLFVIDSRAAKLWICKNPDCKEPYFLRGRITQNFCNRPECKEYAATFYQHRWWIDKGREQREASKYFEPDSSKSARKNKKTKSKK